MAVSAASALIHERAGHPHLQYLTQQQGTQAAVGVKKIERVNNIFYSLLARCLSYTYLTSVGPLSASLFMIPSISDRTCIMHTSRDQCSSKKCKMHENDDTNDAKKRKHRGTEA